MISAVVPGFLPSTHGLRFVNRFPPQRTLFLRIAGRPILALGNAADGLCGGMCLVVRQRFEGGLEPWLETEPPDGGSPHFRELVRRQIDTFEFGLVPLRLYSLMTPRPTRATRWSRLLHRPPLAEEMVRREWPRIRADIDAGRLSMVGLVRVRSADPRLLGRNHQVLCYGYRLDGDSLALAIYDPNHPLDDSVEVRLRLSEDRRSAAVSSSTGEPLVAFLRAG
ncbi:MAG: hypothetical protein ACYDCI_10765 [Candidatus Limnocylindrales bacterium]